MPSSYSLWETLASGTWERAAEGGGPGHHPLKDAVLAVQRARAAPRIP